MSVKAKTPLEHCGPVSQDSASMGPAWTDFGSNAARQASLKSKPRSETESTDWWDHLGGSFLGTLGGAIGDSVEHMIAFWEQLTETSGFEQATAGDVDYEDMPEQITLPDSLNEGMQDAWSDSLPRGRAQEQGGIFVENTDGSQEWKRGPAGTSGSFSPNFGDADANERMLAMVHTHPYDKTEGGHTDVTFSGGDFASLVYQDSPQMDLTVNLVWFSPRSFARRSMPSTTTGSGRSRKK